MEKNKECSIAQDLLLNYVDSVLNQDSKEFVEGHLKTCQKCQEKLNDIRKDIEGCKESEEKEIDYLKSVKKKISKKNKFIIIIGLLLFIIIIINVLVFWNFSRLACELQIYLTDDITESQLKEIEQISKSKDKEAEIVYHSKQEGLDQMKEKLKEKSYLLNQYEENNIFPAWYTVKAKLSVVKEIKESVEMIPGVKKITSYVDNNPYDMFIYTCAQFFQK